MSGDGAAAGDGGERLAAEARASAEALLDWLGPRLDDARRGGPGRTTDTAPQGPFTQGPFTQGPFTQGPFTQDSSADRPPQSPGPCSWCPVCALVAALRGEQPELTARLADQAAGLVVLVRLLLEGHGSHHHGRASEYPRPTPDPAAPDAPPDVRVRPDPARHRAAEAPTPDATPERPTGRRSPRPSPRLRAVTPDDGPTGSAPPGTPPGRRRPDVQRDPGPAGEPAGAVMTVGVDVGGTSVRAALVDAYGTVRATASAPTAGTPAALDDTVCDLVATVAAQAGGPDVGGPDVVGQDVDGEGVAAVGLAVAGFVDPGRRAVSFGAHLPWRDDPVVERLAARLGLPVTLEHDANAAGLAEHRVGAAAGASVAVLVALGTGIGAALLVDGRIFRGAHGVAPELGHLVVVPGGHPCPCGKRGCLERYCSGTALAASAEAALSHGEEFSTLRASWERARPITGRDVADAAAAGDRTAARIVAEFATWLGQGLALVADVLDPDVVVIGGEVSTSAPLWLDAAVAAYAEQVTGAGHRRLATVRPARLGGRAGMVGAALDARERALERPA